VVTPPRDWRPSAPRENLQLRARILAEIRAFFSARSVMEVETPLLGAAAATDPHLDSFACRYHGPHAPQGCDLYLQTSPEFAMKRLLAAGSGPIYQICKAFRNGEAGRRHNPEFSLLEWYRPGVDHHGLMDEVEALIDALLHTGPARRMSYEALFEQALGLDVFRLSVDQARACLREHGVNVNLDETTRDDWLALILTHILEPRLGPGAVFIHDFPASQAMLARLDGNDPPRAQRFELYVDGVELANGFHELADAAEQRRRFEQDRHQRRRHGLAEVPMDETLIHALQHGLPDCAGVALGLDRLLMLAAETDCIAEVVSFPIERS
jgi:lysyl-tRNA synthetase class 2